MQLIKAGQNMHSYRVGFVKGPPQDKSKENRKKTIIEIKVKHESESRKTAGVRDRDLTNSI